MRDQLAKLKDMLNSERMITERVMRRTMSEKANKLMRRSIALIVLALIFSPYMIWAMHFLGFNIIYGYIGAAFLLIAAFYEWQTCKGLRDEYFSRYTIVEIAETMIRYKRMNIQWLYFSIPFLVIWFGGMGYEIWKTGEIAVACGAVVGLIVGLVFGISNLAKSLRTANEIINATRDLKREE
ncbi:MAG: hypothetical protein J6R90_06620 [Alistipes sp.]|nr:hypothetical protein [Alistipes sp.]